jgi:hypothetical protein
MHYSFHIGTLASKLVPFGRLWLSMHNHMSAISMREAPRPHRSHRTLAHGHPWARAITTLILGLVATYVFLRFAWPPLMGQVVAVTDSSGRMIAPFHDALIGVANMVPVPELPLLNLSSMLWIAGVCALILVVTSFIPGRNTPVRYWVCANAVVLMLSALYAFFAAHVAYDGTSFMLLVERTSLLMILCAPIFLAFVAALLPFTVGELALMLVLMVLSDTIFAALRISAFALIVSHTGAIAEMNLYMLFGPLMDVVYFITIYSMVIVSLSRRLNLKEGAWQWL